MLRRPPSTHQSLIILLLLVLTAGAETATTASHQTGTAQSTTTSPQSTTTAQQTDVAIARLRNELEPRINEEIQKGRLPGMAIGIVKDGKLIYAKGFGVARLGANTRAGDNNTKASGNSQAGDKNKGTYTTTPDGNVAITPNSLFHMASVTKTFVATAVMQLVEQNKIDLDAPLTRYLPYFKMADERYKAIKIRQLLSHTSGIPDTTDYHWDKPEYDDGALERLVRSIANQKLVFAPGEKFAYSNTAYEVLGDVIAKVSGESFEDYVQHHILTPLGMKDSTLLVREANPQLLTSPHVAKGNKPVVSKVFPYNRAHAPSSTLYSSIEDMSRWAMANLNHGELDGKRILKRETAELMQQPVVRASPKMQEAISWFLAEDNGRHFVLHSGGDVGFRSLLVLDPQDSLAVVGMENFGEEGKSQVNDYVNIAIRIMLGRPATPAATATTQATDAPANAEEARRKADDILATYVTALGGRTALEKINSRTAQGTFETIGLALAGPVELFAKAPNKMLSLLQVPGQATLKEGFDGTVGWGEDPDDGLLEKTGLELGTAMRDADFYQPLKLRQQYPNLVYKGMVKIALSKPDGGKGELRDLFALEAPRNGRPRIFYFDPRNGLLVRSEEHSAKGEISSAEEYDDYREVDGVKVPFVIHHLENFHFVIKLSEVKQNVPIDDAVFAKPRS